MGKKEEKTTKVILKKLAIVFVSFYLVYYVVALIFCGAFGLWIYLPRAPFNFKQFGLRTMPELGIVAFILILSVFVANFLTTVVDFVLFLILITCVVRSSDMAWDYSLTVMIFHFFISCIGLF
jgi:hypothetical protein